MPKIYSSEVHAFIRDSVENRATSELAELVNAKFDTNFTQASMKSYKANYKLKSNTSRGQKIEDGTKLWPLDVQQFIRDNIRGNGTEVLTLLVNKKFGSNYIGGQVRAYCNRFGLKSEVNTQFQKGQISLNKGKKGEYSPGCEKGWFKLGQAPVNHKPIGSERIDAKDGYVLIKVAEPNIWRLKHQMLWEEVNGAVPAGYCLTFLDRDKLNIELNNLALITRRESLMLTRTKLRSEISDITKTGILIAKVKIAGFDKKKKIKGGTNERSSIDS